MAITIANASGRRGLLAAAALMFVAGGLALITRHAGSSSMNQEVQLDPHGRQLMTRCVVLFLFPRRTPDVNRMCMQQRLFWLQQLLRREHQLLRLL